MYICRGATIDEIGSREERLGCGRCDGWNRIGVGAIVRLSGLGKVGTSAGCEKGDRDWDGI